jgi:DNA polymerase III epsilon subunit-like protein
MSDVMIDIETLGLTPNSVILTIAAVRFNRCTGEVTGGTHLRVNPNQPDRRIDEGSLRWWFTQAAKSITDAFSGHAALPEALRLFAEFIRDDDVVWSQGTDFDFPVLQDAFSACGLSVPWKYWAKRDTRTVYDVCGFDPRTIEREGTYHNALDDCRHHIKCIVAAMQKFNAGGALPPENEEKAEGN